MTTPISIHSNQKFNLMSRMDSRSMRSSGDNSSSGNGSDVELLSIKKPSKNRSQQQQQQMYIQSQQQQSNYYEIAQFNTSSKSDKNSSRSSKHRGLDSVPKELRTSKQSFQQSEKPCEFFVDVM